MSEISNLIHTGLPWSSPQKIAIHSSQYINNMVINRGLLSLLNNDYYLEVKTEAINNFIENNIKDHINDQNLHVSWKRINSLLTEISSETKDTVYFIPLYHNGKPVQFDIIDNIFLMLPKNLNGHTVVLCFCNAFSSSFTDQRIIHPIINLNNYGILINGFIGGDLIIYSTIADNIVINDCTVLSQLRATQAYTLTIFNKVQEAIDSKVEYNKYGREGLTLQGNGLNKNYSVLAIKNCQASVYITNIEIQNILDWSNLQIEKNKISYLPQKDDVLNFYTLTDYDNKKLIYKQLYLNKNYLYKNNNYFLNFINGKEEYIKKQDQEEINSQYLELNLSSYLKINTTPQYLTFDNNSRLETLITQQLRSYIYNWNGETNQFTIAFWGNMIENDDLSYTNSPIFSDYIVNGDKNFGLYVYVNKVYRTPINDIKDSTEYYSDFQKYYLDILNNWGLYVLQFIHDQAPLKGLNNISVPVFNDIRINDDYNDDYMRINLSFYPLKDYKCRILIPNSVTVNNINNYENETDKRNYLRKVGYEIPNLQKSQFQKYIYSLKFFANKHIDNEFQSLKNWDYFSGKFRNLFFFKKILTTKQIQGILKLSPFYDSYHWLYANQSKIIEDIDEHSTLGAIYSENNQNLNLIKANIKI